MKMEISHETPLDKRQGRPAEFPYDIFKTDAVVKFTAEDHDKVRTRINNISTQAKVLGHKVRTYMIQRDSTWIGCVTRKH